MLVKTKRKPFLLIIMDGFGVSTSIWGNAIKSARTPHLDHYFSHFPYAELDASSHAVGLPKGNQGSSEVGHLNIGAGRLVEQEEVFIDHSIANKDFFTNESLLKTIDDVKKNNSKLHIMGLLQDQGVHAHQDHLFALMRLCAYRGIKPILHIFTDGRDTPPRSTKKYFKKLLIVMKKYNAVIGTVMGRYFSMDRDNRWDRTKIAFDGIVNAQGQRESNWENAIDMAYSHKEDDEFITPKIIGDYNGMNKDDGVIFFNYRLDRPRQLTQAIVEKDFKNFNRGKYDLFKSLSFCAMTPYYPNMNARIAFPTENHVNVLGEYVSKLGLKQLRIAETEKYAHVTFFFNDKKDKPFKNEDRILIPSPRIATYDLQPEMSALKISTTLVKELRKQKYDLIILNFANCDMVGHTGNFDATVKAVEVVDKCVNHLVEEVMTLDGNVLITADHGNAEKMMDKFGKPITSHTTAKVPLCLVGEAALRYRRLVPGKLGDIAPTILKIMDVEIPNEMTGNVLVRGQ